MTVRLLAIGTATPPGTLGQSDAATLARALAPPPPAVPEGLIETLHRRTRIDQRASVLIDPATGAQSFFAHHPAPPPTTADRMRLYAEHASGLAHAAASEAVARASLDPARISHLITVSCTGFASPGVDHALVRALPLQPSVARTHIGFMGCHGALNALAVARSICCADPAAVALVVCVELCSIHLHTTDRTDRLIANALFADGAAAAVVAQSTDAAHPELRACRSLLLPDSADLMAWHIGDHGFEMTLGATVPERLAATVPQWIDSVLDSCSLKRPGVGGWAIHPGGPRIIESLRAALDLPEAAVADAQSVLQAQGNMSSGTVLFILKRMLDRDGAEHAGASTPASTRAAATPPAPPALPATPRPWIAMAFGPGLAAECAVIC